MVKHIDFIYFGCISLSKAITNNPEYAYVLSSNVWPQIYSNIFECITITIVGLATLALKIAAEQQYVSYLLMKFAISHECLQNNNIQEAFALPLSRM